jgi:hypothetical protein
VRAAIALDTLDDSGDHHGRQAHARLIRDSGLNPQHPRLRESRRAHNLRSTSEQLTDVQSLRRERREEHLLLLLHPQREE